MVIVWKKMAPKEWYYKVMWPCWSRMVLLKEECHLVVGF